MKRNLHWGTAHFQNHPGLSNFVSTDSKPQRYQTGRQVGLSTKDVPKSTLKNFNRLSVQKNNVEKVNIMLKRAEKERALIIQQAKTWTVKVAVMQISYLNNPNSLW